ncbi:MAG: S41 family peptidase [Acidobacteria bacterium]|nr:S41 family peptidase [Acidobacteriota bacterium]
MRGRSLVWLMLVWWHTGTLLFAQGSAASSVALSVGVIRRAVAEIAAIVEREYVDAAAAARIASVLRQRLQEGAYTAAASPDTLAAQLNRDLLSESQDRHLWVATARPLPVQATDTSAREEAVRRTNGGVQRVEVLPGNVGYLNLTVFWRLEEARDAVGEAMRLLRRADALIIDMRENGGGSPETVALLAGYLIDEPGAPLFDIVSRSGERTTYATPRPGVPERDARRPVYVLTAARTFSGGEGFAYLLQERARAQVIGERTAGAANAGQPYRVNAWLEVTVPNGRVEAAITRRSWEGSGVTPDVTVSASDALRIAHARALDRLIPAATGDWRTRLEQARQALGAF